MLTQGSDDLAHDAFTGNMLCLLSSVFFAIYLILSKKLLEEIGLVTVMKYVFGGAALSGLVISTILAGTRRCSPTQLMEPGIGCRGWFWHSSLFSLLTLVIG